MTLDLWRALIGAIIGMATFGIVSHFAMRRPSHRMVAQMQGVMSISRLYIAASVILMVGLGVVLLGPWMVLQSPLQGALGAVCILLGLLSLIGLVPTFVTTWDARGLTAPADICGFPFPGKRRAFTWDSLVAIGTDMFGQQYVIDGKGRKLRWNFSYRGHRALMRAIAAYRPDLF